MKYSGIMLLLAFGLFACNRVQKDEAPVPVTVCNPMDLSYRFCIDEPSRREAADPTVIFFRDRYFLFASKSSGYWHSPDLASWTFVETTEIPTEEYAPTVVAIGDTLYFLASSAEQSNIYKSVDPLGGKWSLARENLEVAVWDPAFLLDDDGRLYLYWGCSNVTPTYGVELDYRNHFSFIGKPAELIRADTERYGWEVPGDYNTLVNQAPWIEGSWMNKINGKYYLQFAGPGTEFKSYADGVAVSDHPLGPFVYQDHNPFAAKPGGFATGAGHGSTFTDRHGNLWHIGTVTISQKHIFERRLALYPSFMDADGILFTETAFGDYPMIIPDRKIESAEELFPGWMLLSFGKEVSVSSSVDSLPASNMTDEDIRTYWAAESGDKGEYAVLDLGKPSDVYAIQLSFAEHGTRIFGRQKGLYQRFTLEGSTDGKDWFMLADRSENADDRSHPYIVSGEKVSCRYLKVTNVEVPGGSFAISGFRVFGKGAGPLPGSAGHFQAVRNSSDRRTVELSWDKPDGAVGYLVRYGLSPEKMYSSSMVYGDTVLTIRSLDAASPYFFTVDSFNENGISKGDQVISAE